MQNVRVYPAKESYNSVVFENAKYKEECGTLHIIDLDSDFDTIVATFAPGHWSWVKLEWQKDADQETEDNG